MNKIRNNLDRDTQNKTDLLSLILFLTSILNDNLAKRRLVN